MTDRNFKASVRRNGAGNIMRGVLALSLAVAPLAALHAQAPVRTTGYQWVTLGTVGGPLPAPGRGQPANLLHDGKQAILIDAGDGAASQMLKAGVPFPQLKAVFLSHLHFDHIGGLFAVLALRNQTGFATVPLTVYGPKGTGALIAGLASAMQLSTEAGYGYAGASWTSPWQGVQVVELNDGDSVSVGDVKVTAAANSHFSYEPGSIEASRFVSLSYRFDTPRRSIAYTGDTGPSAAVTRLARGADLLVSEMVDLETVMAMVDRVAPNLPKAERDGMQKHLAEQHLSTRQVGEMARSAGVKQVVVTHLAGGGPPANAPRYVEEIRREYRGPVTIASDLDRF
jgi:ribonuclease BN (tRNA processing enzyme)